MRRLRYVPVVVFIMIPQLVLLLLGSSRLLGQTTSFNDEAAAYFNEIRIVTAQHKDLWNFDLYAPMLLVEPKTRSVYANTPDTAGLLTRQGEIFVGTLPAPANIANTSLRWNGVQWAMVMLPLPTKTNNRLNLLAHELFHRAQPHLEFVLPDAENNHLDKKDGRIYLRLELEALRSAVESDSRVETMRHVTNALAFRAYRYALFPSADSTENLLELNEGLAEYTGMMMSGRTDKEQRYYLSGSLTTFLKNPTFVRSFAYQTIPMYGYVLHRINQNWNRLITPSTNLSAFFKWEFSVDLPTDLKAAVAKIIDQYGSKNILAIEKEREAAINTLLAEYRRKFIEHPHLDIPLRKMNISFDPRNLMPLDDKGVVYPNLRITDEWGILTVTDGALRSPTWDRVTVTAPVTIEEDKVTGADWTLELTPGFVVRKDSTSENHVLINR